MFRPAGIKRITTLIDPVDNRKSTTINNRIYSSEGMYHANPLVPGEHDASLWWLVNHYLSNR